MKPAESRLPPGQQWAAPGKWPLVGERHSAPPPDRWVVEIAGCVANPLRLDLDQLGQLPQVERQIDIHCVTRWSLADAPFGGVPLAELLRLAEPTPSARFISFVAHSSRGHSTSLPLDEAVALESLVALRYAGQPLTAEHGGPVRLVVPGRYFYKSLKWLVRLDLLALDRLGYWEAEAGYHNRADPWQEERYLSPDLDRQAVRHLLAGKNLDGQNLRSLAAAGLDLTGLRAEGAVLRDADFRRSRLAGASFVGANLTNAHFQQADLREASFHQADCEGADFVGADLRGADFRGASLFGATFCPADSSVADIDASKAEHDWGGTQIDGATRFDEAALEALMPPQAAWVRWARQRAAS